MEKNNRLGKAECPGFLASNALVGYRATLARVRALRNVNISQLYSLSALLDHPQRVDAHGNSPINSIAFYCTLLNPRELTEWLLHLVKFHVSAQCDHHLVGRRMQLSSSTIPVTVSAYQSCNVQVPFLNSAPLLMGSGVQRKNLGLLKQCNHQKTTL